MRFRTPVVVGVGLVALAAGTLTSPARAAAPFTPSTGASIAAGEDHVVKIAADGTPWAVGGNTEGQLGTGSTAPRTQFTEMAGWPQDRRAVAVAAGEAATYVLDDLGRVWSTGDDELGQQARGVVGGSDSTSLALTQGIPVGRRATRIASALDSLIVLLDDGTVVGAGRGTNGQLTGTLSRGSLAPLTGMGSVKAVAIASGHFHTVVLDELGQPWVTGAAISGSLGGLPTVSTLTRVTNLPAGVPIVGVSAGSAQTYLLGGNGRVYGVGANSSGQLGIGTDQASVVTFERMLGTDSAVAVSGGLDHAVVVDREGTVLVTGDNASGQLGRPKTTARNLQLREMVIDGASFDPSSGRTSEVAAGRSVSLTRDVDGFVYGAGENSSRQLWAASDADVESLRRLRPQVVRAFAAPTVSGDVTVGSTLTSSTGGWSPTPGGYTYVWKRDGVTVQEGPGRTYGVTPDDVGRSITVTVFGFITSFGINDDSVTSEAVRIPVPVVAPPVVASDPPVNTRLPAITGTRARGKTLKASVGTWRGAGSSYSYRWLRDGKAVSGATKRTYKLTSRDRGRRISVRVTATKPGFASVRATSRAVRISKR